MRRAQGSWWNCHVFHEVILRQAWPSVNVSLQFIAANGSQVKGCASQAVCPDQSLTGTRAWQHNLAVAHWTLGQSSWPLGNLPTRQSGPPEHICTLQPLRDRCCLLSNCRTRPSQQVLAPLVYILMWNHITTEHRRSQMTANVIESTVTLCRLC